LDYEENIVRRIAVLIIILLGAYAALAQAPEPPKTPTPPQITAEFKAEFFKAQLEMTRAQTTMQTAQAHLQAMIQEFQKLCKDDEPQVTQQGDPTCAVRVPVVTQDKFKNGVERSFPAPAPSQKPASPESSKPQKK
jgi:hypothetical protein